MKKLLLSAAAIFLAQFCFAQNIECRVTDTEGKRIEFVTATIEGTPYGAVSNESGYLSITLPDSLDSEYLIFSHISFEELRVNIGELRERSLSASDKATLKLERRNIVTPEAIVSAKKLKPVIIAGAGIPTGIIDCVGSSTLNTTIANSLESREWRSFGKLFTSKSKVLLSSIDFKARCAIDSVVLRVNIYRVAPDRTIVPISKNPIYIDIRKSNELIPYSIDITSCEAFGQGDIFIDFSFLQPIDPMKSNSKAHRIMVDFPINTGSYHISVNGRVAMVSPMLGPSITVRGIKFKDR